MSTPRDVRIFVSDIKSRGIESLTTDQFYQLCHFALIHLPNQCERKGKKCPHCSWKIGNAAKTCKNCGRSVEKQHIPYVAPPDGADDCMGECACDLSGQPHHQLSCGHKFCFGCMQNRVSTGFTTCTMCDRVQIDTSILQKYLPPVL